MKQGACVPANLIEEEKKKVPKIYNDFFSRILRVRISIHLALINRSI